MLGLLAHRQLAGRRPTAARRGTAPDGLLSRRLLRVAAAGGVLAVLAVPGQLLVQVSGGGAHWSRLLWQQAGSGRWLIRELGLGAVLAAVCWAARVLPSPAAPDTASASEAPAVDPPAAQPRLGPAVALGAVGVLLAAAGTAQLGHPMAGGPAATFVGGLHVLAAAGWAGSVLAAAFALVPVLRAEPDRAGGVRELLRAFGMLAVTCVAVLAITGVLLTGAQVATVDALLTTPYGLILLAKVALVVVAGLLGLATTRAVRRPAGRLSQPRLVTEAVALAGVLALAGALAAAGPARGPRFPTTQIVTSPEVSGQAADLVDTVAIRPNRPGRNIVSVTVSDTRRPAPAPVTGVSVLLRGPDGSQRVHPVTRGPDGWTVAVDDIRTAGDWSVSVTVMREGLTPATDVHRWAVAPLNDASTRVLVSAAALQPWLDWTAALGGFAATIAVALFGYRRLRRRYPVPDEPALSTVDDEARELQRN
jgi:copper transport protein